MTKTNSKIFNPKKIPSIKRSGNVLTKVFINKKTGSRSMISGVT